MESKVQKAADELSKKLASAGETSANATEVYNWALKTTMRKEQEKDAGANIAPVKKDIHEGNYSLSINEVREASSKLMKAEHKGPVGSAVQDKNRLLKLPAE